MKLEMEILNQKFKNRLINCIWNLPSRIFYLNLFHLFHIKLPVWPRQVSAENSVEPKDNAGVPTCKAFISSCSMCSSLGQYMCIVLSDSVPKLWSAVCSPGCLATVGALVYGLRSFQQGDTNKSQLFMRGRIAAQGFTVVALVVGVLATALTSKKWRRTSPSPLPLSSHHHTTWKLIRSNSEWWTDCTICINWVKYCFQHDIYCRLKTTRGG